MTESQARSRFGKTDALLLLMALIWGINFSVVKYATKVMTPLSFTGIRVVLAAIVLLAFAFARGGKFPKRKDILSLIALGMLGNGFYQILFVEGVARTKAGNAALIVAATPALIAIVSRVRGIESVNWRVHAGIALSLAGVGLVVLGSATTSHDDTTLLGTTLVFCGTLCWTAFTVLLQPFARRLDAIQLSAFTMLGGSIPMIVLSPYSLANTTWSSIGARAWLAILYASVLSMGLAYLFWYRGLKVLGATRTAVYSNVQPVIALIVAWIFLHESPTIWQGVGTGTIVTGLFLTRS
jgi:drug/metabolite transporter (DMT)-like permease